MGWETKGVENFKTKKGGIRRRMNEKAKRIAGMMKCIRDDRIPKWCILIRRLIEYVRYPLYI